MKNKFLLSILLCAIFAIFNFNTVHASWEIKDDTLIVHNEAPGCLADNFRAKQIGKYKTLVVEGDISVLDFSVLKLMAHECRTVDLSGARTTVIPSGAFSMMYNIEKFVLPKTLEFVGRGAFAQCANMTIDSLPRSLKTIESYAFFNCTSLTLTVPESVQVGVDVFKDCPNVHLPEALSTPSSNISFTCCRLL